MRREKGMLSSLTKIKINLIASLLHWHDSCCESSNQKGKLILQLLIKWYLCASSYYSRSKNNYDFGEFVHTIFHRIFLLERASLLNLSCRHLQVTCSLRKLYATLFDALVKIVLPRVWFISNKFALRCLTH